MAHAFYGSLAPWWPLISPVADYADESAHLGDLLLRASVPVRTVLELGSGGGHSAFHLKDRYELVLVDLAEPMLEVSRVLNPECAHHCGDMRSVRLGRRFDAVFVHDAVDYMRTEADLRALLETARAHLHPGGVVLLAPDHVAEAFAPSTDCGGADHPDGRGVRYLEWSWDPDPGDTEVTTEYAFLLRAADSTVASLHETHTTGLFPTETWVRLLQEAGLRAEVLEEETEDERVPRTLFLGHTQQGP